MQAGSTSIEGHDTRTHARARRFVRDEPPRWAAGFGDEPHRVLLVGADATQLMLLRRTLEIDGYHVVDCETGRDAVVALTEAAPDLLLVNAPLRDGSVIALLRWLRARPATAHVACLVIAPAGGHDSVAEIYDAGAELVLQRPTEVALLSRKVGALLSRRAAAFVA